MDSIGTPGYWDYDVTHPTTARTGPSLLVLGLDGLVWPWCTPEGGICDPHSGIGELAHPVLEAGIFGYLNQYPNGSIQGDHAV